MAKKISDEILELNGRPPKAVMLVGGGSLTPELTTHVADQLRLPRNRVAIRGIDAIQKLDRDHLPANIGPELVTPIGIAINTIPSTCFSNKVLMRWISLS